MDRLSALVVKSQMFKILLVISKHFTELIVVPLISSAHAGTSKEVSHIK